MKKFFFYFLLTAAVPALAMENKKGSLPYPFPEAYVGMKIEAMKNAGLNEEQIKIVLQRRKDGVLYYFRDPELGLVAKYIDGDKNN